MALVTWANWNVKYSDLRKIIKSLGMPLSSDSNEIEADIGDAWERAKDKLGDKLDVCLPDFFVNRSSITLGLSYEQFLTSHTYTDLDNVKDVIANKDKLLNVASYMTIKEMLFSGEWTERLGYQNNITLLALLREQVEKEIKDLWNTAITLLWIDLNSDGIKTDNERVRTKNTTLWPT